MKLYNIVSVLALLVLVLALPLYATRESLRMDLAQTRLREQYVADAALLYVEACLSCHGPDGAGVGAMPALNGPHLAKADGDLLYRTIANSPHGSAMAAWHVEEGGILTSYEVRGLVALIQHADWQQVEALASSRVFAYESPDFSEVDLTAMEGSSEDPHECRACHEQPEVHADRFGLNCSRCHGLETWKPALLMRHDFMLDHGDEGQVSCQTCHTTTYAEYTCYECHDHTPEGMAAVHAEEDVFELEPCAACHPTGQEGEAVPAMRAGLEAGQVGATLATD